MENPIEVWAIKNELGGGLLRVSHGDSSTPRLFDSPEEAEDYAWELPTREGLKIIRLVEAQG